MTVKEIKELYKGEYAEVEFYKRTDNIHHSKPFCTDNCYWAEGEDDEEVVIHELMDEEEYNQTLFANCSNTINFEELYGDKNAKVLCIMLK